jgi:ribosome-associated protein
MSQQPGTPSDERSLPDLSQFLKIRDIVASGGEAKVLIQSGAVRVNGEVETRRRRQLQPGDVVTIANLRFEV